MSSFGMQAKAGYPDYAGNGAMPGPEARPPTITESAHQISSLLDEAEKVLIGLEQDLFPATFTDPAPNAQVSSAPCLEAVMNANAQRLGAVLQMLVQIRGRL